MVTEWSRGGPEDDRTLRCSTLASELEGEGVAGQG